MSMRCFQHLFWHKQLLLRLCTPQLTWTPLLLAALACYLCFQHVTGMGMPSGAEFVSGRSAMDHQYSPLIVSAEERPQSVRIKLERLDTPGSYIDMVDVLRAAIYRDGARRVQLERRILANTGHGISTASSSQPAVEAAATTANNGNATSQQHKGGIASLNVISGSSVGSGEYFATVWVGTPSQKLYLIADTGSDLTWVKCSASGRKPAFRIGPGRSAQTNESFDESMSSTFSPLSCLSSQCAAWFFPPTCDGLSRHCKFAYSYTDQSFSTGSLAFESIMLGKTAQTNLLIGCGRQSAGPNFDKAGGVVGLGQGPLSLASQLAAQSVYSNKFSYCLADFFSSSTISGSLAFGDSLLQTAMSYTPLIQNPFAQTYYYVAVQTVKVAGTELNIPATVWEIDGQGNGGTVVDSGTTLAQFAQPAYDMISRAFQQAIQYQEAVDTVEGLDLCYQVDGVLNPQFPEFAIVFRGGLVLQPPQENYFTDVSPGIKCLAMQGVPEGSFSVVGNLLQQNFHMEFDRLNNRLGVSPADCSKLHS